jgi:hypothetical protein
MKWMICLFVFASLGVLMHSRTPTPRNPLVVPPPDAVPQAQSTPLPEPLLSLRILHEELAQDFVRMEGNGSGRLYEVVHAIAESGRDTFAMNNQTWKIEKLELAGLMQQTPVIFETPIPKGPPSQIIRKPGATTGDLALIDKTFGAAEGKPGTDTPKAGYVFKVLGPRNDPQLAAFHKGTKRKADEFEINAMATLMDRSGPPDL